MLQPNDSRPAIILLVEDNVADQRLTERALEENKIRNKLFIVEDGQEAMEYLRNEGKYADLESNPRPDLLLLDIKMPRMDGKQVLREIKNDPELKQIPVVILTTSDHEQDVIDSYNLGVNAYITKPVDYEQFVNTIKSLENFWFDVVVLPSQQR